MASKVVSKAGVRLPIYNERFLTVLLKVLASSREVSRRTLNNVMRFVTIADRPWYSRDFTVGALLDSIDIVLQCRLDGTFDSLEDSVVQNTVLAKISASISSMYGEAKDNIIIPTIRVWKSKESESEFVFKQVNDNIKYNIILTKKDELSDTLTDISSNNVANLEKSVLEFRTQVEDIASEFKKTDSSNRSKSIMHLIEPDFVESNLKEVYKKVRNPKSNLKLGLKMFNEMLSELGGLVMGKYYIIYADVNSFKSAILLYMAKWIQQYNSELFDKRFLETKKRPTVLFVSLENTKAEDIDRSFKIFTERNIGEGQEFDNVRHLWNSSFFQGSNIDISMYHDHADTIRVSDIDTMVDTIEDDGYEVIAIIVDYIELIRPEDKDAKKEKQEWLTTVSNLLYELAGRRDVPVITAHQINREGQRVKNDAKAKGQKNLVRLQNRSYIGGAMAIDKKADFSMFIDVEKDEDPVNKTSKFFLTVKRDKMRYRKTDRDYFAHEIIHGIILKDDMGREGYTSLPEIPANRYSSGEDSLTFSGAKESGSRGQTDVRKKVDMTETVIKVKQTSWIDIIDDKPIDHFFVFAYMMMNQIECRAPYEMMAEEIDGDTFLFDGLFVDSFGVVTEEKFHVI